MAKVKKVQPKSGANPWQAAAARDLRRSGAASAQVRGNRRQGTKRAVKAYEIAQG